MKISQPKGSANKIVMKTKPKSDPASGVMAEWWKADTDLELATQLCGNAAYLKTQQQYRIRQRAVDIRLYAGLSVYSYAGSNVSKMDRTKTLPDDKPTFNLVQACSDTLVAKLSQNEPQPKFLTDNADYKQRHLAQQMNHFMMGEFYQTKAYEKGVKVLRDTLVQGAGAIKIYEDGDRVALDRVMVTDLYVDDNDCINGDPQTLYQLKLVDRDKFLSKFTDKKSRQIIESTPKSVPDNSPDTARTTSDQIIVVEGWRKASGPDPEAPGFIPGRHTIATVQGVIDDGVFLKNDFPFEFLNFDDPFLGFWGRGLGTQLFGIQMSLNRIMYTIARSITLVGVPRVFIEQGSKVVKAHQNNEVGVIVTYSGTKPSYEVAPCNAPEMYAERDRLIALGFQQAGVSSMAATSQKPEGLDSGKAIRSYDDIATDRFAAFSKKYDNFYVGLAYKIADCAMDIAKRTGKYQTVYPNKDGTKEVDLPAMKFLKDPFVIKAFTESSLPSTPAGRMQAITEYIQSGILSLKEGRRLMRVPQDLEQNEKLDNASEERIFKILDAIVESNTYTPPDPFMDLELATLLTVQYINLYLAANLEEKKADSLRTFYAQVQALIAAAMPPPQMAPMPGGAAPPANPEPTPTSPLIPNTNAQAA